MEEPITTSPTTQYIIDRVRLIRHELGLSQREVSRFLSPDTDSNILGNIESIRTNNGYSDHNLGILAHSFTDYARKLLREMDKGAIANSHIKEEYTVFDFYPEKPLSDILQIKTKVELPEGISLTGTLNLILETKDFLNHPRTIREITEYCNSFHDKNWKSNNITSTLEFFVKKSKLKKFEDNDGGVKYQKS